MEDEKETFFDVKVPSYKGIVLPDYPEFMENIEKKMSDIQNFPSRETDIFLCCSMKSGSHWILEITAMLLSGECKNDKETINDNNIELTRVEKFENRSDPRLIHCHLPYSFLPTKHLENGYKIVFMLRNPKDRLVSMYHMIRGIRPELLNLTWTDYFTATLIDKNMPEIYGSWFDYTREWEKAITKHPSNIFPIYFEDLKTDFKPTVEKLADFLGVKRDQSFYEQLAEKCGFEYMQKNKDRDLWNAPSFTVTYRKGEIGDWKNLFTVAQSEQFDALYEHHMKGSNLVFRYQ